MSRAEHKPLDVPTGSIPASPRDPEAPPRLAALQQQAADLQDLVSQLRQRAADLEADARRLQERERALQESEANYRILAEENLAGVYVIQDWRLAYVNQRAAQMFGYTVQEATDLPVMQIVAPESRAEVEANLMRRLGGEVEKLGYSIRGLHKSGAHLDIEVFGSLASYNGAPAIVGTVLDRTEANRMLEALRRSEARFQAFMDNSPTVAFTKDPDGRILYVNKLYRDRLHVGGDPTGKLTDDLYPEAIARRLREHDQIVLRENRSLEVIEDVPVADGDLRRWLVFKFPIHDASGDTVVGGVAVDITERLRAEQALREQTHILQSILDSMGDGVAVVDGSGRFVIFNPAAERICGVGPIGTPEEWSRVYNILQPDGTTPYPPEALPLARAMRGEFVDDAELFLKRGDGREGVWISVSGRPLRDDDGALHGGVVVFHDVTQHRRMLEELRRAEAKYRALVEQLPVVTYSAVWEPVGACTYISPQIEAKLGYTLEEWRLTPDLWAQRLHPDDRGRVLDEMRRCRHTGTFVSEYRMLARDGSVVWFRDEGVVRRDEAGAPRQLQGVMLDVTDRQEARLGHERLQALSVDLVAVQEAERARIARELHDEIGQTLTLLKLNLEMLNGSLAKPAQDRLQQAALLVNDLMGRVRQLSVDLRPGVLDDLGLFAALLGQFDRFTKQTGIRVHFEHLDVERRFPPEIETAAFRMVQEALTNVARHSGAPLVTVRAWSDGAQLGLQVEDEGRGFEAGRVGAPGGAPARGLAGMRERLELLGGKLTIDSSPGQGCRLTGELPLGPGWEAHSEEVGGP